MKGHETSNYDSPPQEIEGKKSWYYVGDFIKKGGNAVVHCCEDDNGNQYAVKFLMRNNREGTLRFLREIKLLSSIQHQFIINYIDSGRFKLLGDANAKPQRPFYVMERADCDLGDFMKSNRNIDKSELVGKIRGLIEALVELHKHAVHRDLKPENILVCGDCWVIGDLGLTKIEHAKLAVTNVGRKVVGPAYWSSPEAMSSYYLKNDSVDVRSDIFQMGMIFWFIINRMVPGGVLTKDDWTGNMPNTFYDVLHQMLQFNPARRYQSAFELLEAWENSVELSMVQ
jgi:serine/threonine-protein kinase